MATNIWPKTINKVVSRRFDEMTSNYANNLDANHNEKIKLALEVMKT